MFNFSKYPWFRAGKGGILIYIWKSVSKIAVISFQKYHMMVMRRLILK